MFSKTNNGLRWMPVQLQLWHLLNVLYNFGPHIIIFDGSWALFYQSWWSFCAFSRPKPISIKKELWNAVVVLLCSCNTRVQPSCWTLLAQATQLDLFSISLDTEFPFLSLSQTPYEKLSSSKTLIANISGTLTAAHRRDRFYSLQLWYVPLISSLLLIPSFALFFCLVAEKTQQRRINGQEAFSLSLSLFCFFLV